MRGRAMLGVAIIVILVVAGWLMLSDDATDPPAVAERAERAEVAAEPPVADRAADAPPAPADVAPAARRPPELAAGDPMADDGPDQLDGDAIAAAWARVDLAAVQRALPDNLYWQMGAPTTDERENERRARERERWNVEYGKVLSGTGTDEEIRAYFDHRARLSGDYVEFTTYLLDHHGEDLTERDVALLTLARRMHLARLEEVPRHMEEALTRKREQDEARARWLADERAFQADDTADDAGAETH
jgi:hypothetical protein